MIDYLTPYEGVVFGGIIALGLLMIISAQDTTQFIGAVLLMGGVWGGVITLVRSLLHREPGGLYLLCFVGALIAGLVKWFVFPELSHSGFERIVWTFIFGIGITGLVGVALNALIRQPPENSEEAQDLRGNQRGQQSLDAAENPGAAMPGEANAAEQDGLEGVPGMSFNSPEAS